MIITRIEHARWFPHCQYAKDLCGERLHARIQLKNAQNQRAKQPAIEGIERLINARLDLPVVEQLRSKYRLDVIKKCIETRLKLGADDFVSTSDLEMACYILQKQIDIIKGHAEHIIIPSRSQLSNTATEESVKRHFGECAICLTEERQVAFVPCGHLCTLCDMWICRSIMSDVSSRNTIASTHLLNGTVSSCLISIVTLFFLFVSDLTRSIYESFLEK